MSIAWIEPGEPFLLAVDTPLDDPQTDQQLAQLRRAVADTEGVVAVAPPQPSRDGEMATIFATEWQCVGRSADIPKPGDYLTAELPTATGSRSVIVLRNDAGQLSAFVRPT